MIPILITLFCQEAIFDPCLGYLQCESLQERLKELTTIMRSSGGYNGPIDTDFVERQRRDTIASRMTVQPSGACDFVSRSTPLQPSNVLDRGWRGARRH
jgi:hypothetical protein